jgi:biotin carboxyl carrier protein
MAVVLRSVALVVALALAAACSATENPAVAAADAAGAKAAPAATTTVAAPTTTVTTAPPAPVRTVTEQDWTPFATVGGVVLTHPARVVEHVGFHEANHDGARELEVLATAVRPITLESRERLTGAHSAADVVVEPSAEIRSPVTGTVKRAGTYVLYCDNTDEFLVVEPDAHPGWEVKLLHVVGLQVRPGDRVVAGETLVALHAHQLPFESQVDEVRTADPAWPHVHVEVVDPSIRNRPSPGEPGC